MQAVNLSVSELQMYGTVKWLNASDALGKIKKGVEMLTVVFIFKSAVVLLAHERIKTKKKSKVGLYRTTVSISIPGQRNSSVTFVKYFRMSMLAFWNAEVLNEFISHTCGYEDSRIAE